MLYGNATCKPLLLLFFYFYFFIFYLKIYQNMGQKLGSNKEYVRYSLVNLTKKDLVCQFLRKLDGKPIPDL